MSKRASSWAKRFMVATAFTTYMMPGCNGLLNNPNFRSLLDSTLANGEFEFEFGFDGDFEGFGDGQLDGDDHGGHDDDSDDDFNTE